jgi:hypothetical protein
MASSLVRISAYDQLSQPGSQSEPLVHRRLWPGDDDARESHAAGVVKDAASVLKGLAQRHLEASCVMLISQSIFKRQATSSSTMAQLTPTSNWRITTSHAKRAEEMMTHLSSSSSRSTGLIPLGHG